MASSNHDNNWSDRIWKGNLIKSINPRYFEEQGWMDPTDR